MNLLHTSNIFDIIVKSFQQRKNQTLFVNRSIRFDDESRKRKRGGVDGGHQTLRACPRQVRDPGRKIENFQGLAACLEAAAEGFGRIRILLYW